MIENLDTLIIFQIWMFPVNATLFYTWIVMALLVGGSWLITRRLKTGLYVSRWQTALEMIVMGVRKQIYEVSNDNPAKYLPIISTFFLFIGLSNLLTIIPIFKAPTSSLSTTAAFALCVFLAMPYYGVKNAGIVGYLKKYIDPTPIMLPMNILSDFSSMFSLAFRLYGNVLSGAIIGSVLITLAPFLLPLPMQILGLLTGTIQAYIFALLAIVYISAVSPETKYIDKFQNDKYIN